MARKVVRGLDEGPPAADTWICPNCGNRNVESFYVCAKCGQKKREQESAGMQGSRNAVHRPFGMTLIALYLLIVGGSTAFGFADGPPDPNTAFGNCFYTFIGVYVLTAVGIWRMQKWGMWLTVVWLGSLMLLDATVALSQGAIDGQGGLMNLLIFTPVPRALIILWLVKNREQFDRHTRVDPDIFEEQLKSSM